MGMGLLLAGVLSRRQELLTGRLDRPPQQHAELVVCHVLVGRQDGL